MVSCGVLCVGGMGVGAGRMEVRVRGMFLQCIVLFIYLFFELQEYTNVRKSFHYLKMLWKNSSPWFLVFRVLLFVCFGHITQDRVTHLICFKYKQTIYNLLIDFTHFFFF